MTALMRSLGDLAERAVASSEDRSAWLAARARGVTATEVAKLAKEGDTYARSLAREKRSGVEQADLSHNRYIRWGQIREEFVAEWIARRWDIAPNQTLFHAVGNVRHLATPDGVGVDFDDQLRISEVKTSKHDLCPGTSDPLGVLVLPKRRSAAYFWKTGYYEQVQWQLHVTGARQALFAYEQHDDDWSRWPEQGPSLLAPQPGFVWITRDEQRIGELVKVADGFLALLDSDEDDTEFDAEIDLLAQQVLEGRVLEGSGKATKDQAWKELQSRLSSRTSFSQAGAARVTWSAASESVVEEIDDEAAVEADPGLFAAMEDARKAWESHRAGFVKQVVKVGAPRLTVTVAKKEKGE